VDLVVGVAVTEQLTVVAVIPVVDTRSTEVSFNVKEDVLKTLPLERTYRGLFQLIPGVPDNRSPIGPAAGGNRQDNTYLIDGANITNPAYGYLSTEINELDIAEVNLKRAGVTAEFGRTGGSITNVVSRTGSNRLSGLARLDWLPRTRRRLQTAGRLACSAAFGPVRSRSAADDRDGTCHRHRRPAEARSHLLLRLARYSRETKWNRFNKVGTPLPDEAHAVQEYYGKLTAVPTVRHQLNVSYPAAAARHRRLQSRLRQRTISRDRHRQQRRVASADWAYFLDARTSAERALPVHEGEQREHPDHHLGYLPTFNPAAWRPWVNTTIRRRRI
jgi:hypothetical protein